MSIDLSKAKVGDKFRTRDGKIVEYVGENQKYSDDKYEIIDKHGNKYTYFQYGNCLINEEVGPDLVEQVFSMALAKNSSRKHTQTARKAVVSMRE